MRVHQINLQPHFGGGEAYTAFMCRALDARACATTLYVSPRATFWDRLGLPASTRRIAVPDFAAIPPLLPEGALWLLGHGPLPPAIVGARREGWLLSAIAHMPVQGRNPRQFDGHDMVFAVSQWVRDGLLAAGIPAWDEALLGIADLAHRAGSGELRRNSRYDWDRRKFRDRLLGSLEPLWAPLRPRRAYARRNGLSLGIVSRLTPIKQFPRLFEILAPVIARHPGVFLEIFGSGGYASVRDLRRALRPIAGRVRFWGQQTDVRAAYAGLDYLLAGLPEKEALGLNLIEAQVCDLPVLAVRAPPFTETVAEGRSGHFYRDPRDDGGADFERLLARLVQAPERLHPARAEDHLARFSEAAFGERVARVADWAAAELARRAVGPDTGP